MSADLTHHGVPYSTGSGSRPPALTLGELKTQGIKHVRITWLLQTSRPGTSITKASLGLAFITIADGFNATGEYLYACNGWFEEKNPIPGLSGQRALEVDLCPRTILRRVIDHARDAAGVEFLEAQIMEEISEALTDSGIELQMYHAEAAPGQYEVVTGPLSPLQAVDALIHTRETIFNIASKHGLRATLAPRVFLKIIRIKTTPSSAPQNLSETEAQFLAGVLEHLPYLALLALPTTASYNRMVDGVWSGGTYVCWGTDNREAPVRLCNAASPSSRNLSSRPSTAPRTLPRYGRGERSAAQLSEEERKALGVTARMPLSWEEARTKFAKSVIVDSVFGADFKTKFLSVNKSLKEQLTFGLMDNEELKLLVETF
ncbi:hypothetical protein BJ912DRAFT_967039 [Pholiota molesta]|nr:hypothetical protein BJ912DRAFT_967039 [Pholiota molesta]